MCTTQERGHIREQQKERLNKVSHFLYHYDTKKHKRVHCAQQSDSQGSLKKHISIVKTCINQPAMYPGE
jgi:hypothetical protein